jgi:hypothetical protein
MSTHVLERDTEVSGYEISHPDPGRFSPHRPRLRDTSLVPSGPEKTVSVIAFAVVTVMWTAFIMAMFLEPSNLTHIWNNFRDQFVGLQAIEGLLLLPWVLGLAMWTSGWDVWLRYLTVFGLAWTTIYLFFPWRREEVR